MKNTHPPGRIPRLLVALGAVQPLDLGRNPAARAATPAVQAAARAAMPAVQAAIQAQCRAKVRGNPAAILALLSPADRIALEAMRVPAATRAVPGDTPVQALPVLDPGEPALAAIKADQGAIAAEPAPAAIKADPGATPAGPAPAAIKADRGAIPAGPAPAAIKADPGATRDAPADSLEAQADILEAQAADLEPVREGAGQAQAEVRGRGPPRPWTSVHRGRSAS
ncbi:MAG TPA: hypothetical protein VLH39_07425 [Magnetospirillaceae bacterium]|nr:hypothetical protein [Magnetospirillaceae bacterium]